MDSVTWKPIFSNPIVERYRRTDLKGSQFWVYLCAYLLLSCTVVLIMAIDSGVSNRVPALCADLFYWFVGIELVLLWFIPFARCGTALTDEINGGTIDFLRMLPLEPWRKALGLIAGRSLVPFVLAAINLIPITALAVTGGVNPEIILHLAVSGASVSFLLGVTGSLYSTLDRSDMRKIVFLPLIFSVFAVIPAAVEIFSKLASRKDIAVLNVNFFRTNTSLLMVLSLGAFYFSIWLFRSLTTRIERSGGSMLDCHDSIMFLIGMFIMILGLMTPELAGAARPAESIRSAGAYLFFSAACLFAMTAGAFRFADDYAEEVGAAVITGMADRKVGEKLRKSSNLAIAVRLAATWAAFAVFVCLVSGKEAVHTATLVGEWLGWFALFTIIVEIDLLYRFRISNIRYATGAAVLALTIMPFILVKVAGLELVLSSSVIGLLSRTFQSSMRGGPFSQLPLSMLTTLPLALFLSALVRKRYEEICRDAIAEDFENRARHLEKPDACVI